MVRLLLQRVVVWPSASSQELRVQLHWSGGTMTEHPIIRAVRGWEQVTEQAITALAAREGEPLVAILWGRDARTLVPLLDDVPCIESAHPSPNSAHNGFFGSRPFSRANHLLEELGGEPLDWKLP